MPELGLIPNSGNHIGRKDKMDDQQKIDPMDIVRSVRRYDRSTLDLEKCGCESCKKALKILEG